MKENIIFDFDGVLVFSEASRFKVIQSSAETSGVSITDDAIQHMVGRLTSEFLQDVVPDQKKSTIPEIIEKYEREYKGNLIKYVQPVEVTVDFIKNYSGPVEFAIASMSSRKKIEELIVHFGIAEKFSAIVSKEEVEKPKPDPEIYKLALEKLQADPEICAVIEDTVIGAQSAIAANIDCYVLLNGHNSEEEFTGTQVKGFLKTKEDLLALVGK